MCHPPDPLGEATKLKHTRAPKPQNKQRERTTAISVTDHETIISEWVAATNTHDTERYLAHFTEDAILDDPSVGERFEGHEGVADYFTRYFIGYNTITRVLSVTPQVDSVHVVVDFTGDFPGGQTEGVFDLAFTGDRISFARADLI